ncbi:tetratricopeptide repeat protein [Candidatus Pandoraea novymonadis]|nr:tetratricopeptide repeat protein [Candidatus Pandoraea novymonadis]
MPTSSIHLSSCLCAISTRASLRIGLSCKIALCATILAIASSTLTMAQDTQKLTASWKNELLLTDYEQDVTTNSLKEQLPKITLSSEILFKILAAEISMQRGQMAPAYNTYLILSQKTKDPRMAHRATEIALGAGQLGDALFAARLWHKLEQKEEGPSSQLLTSLEVTTGHLTEAEPLFLAKLKKLPEARRSLAILEIQKMLARSPDRAKSVESLKRILVNDMHRPEALLAIGRAQIEAGNIRGARISLEKALKLNPHYEEPVVLLAQLRPSANTHLPTMLQSFLTCNPDAKEARLAYIKVLLSHNQLEEAQKQFEILKKRYPNELSILMAVALINLHSKHQAHAKDYLHQYVIEAEAQNSDPSQAYLYLAQIAENKKDYISAENWLLKIKEESHTYLLAQIYRADLLIQQKKIDEALTLIQSIELNDAREKLVLKRAQSDVLVRVKRYDDAEKLLRVEVEAHPNDMSLLYQYGMVAELNRHHDVMEKSMRQIIADQPNNAQAYNALGYSLAERKKHLPEALKLLKKAINFSPQDPHIMDSFGWIKYRLGDKKAALNLLRKAYAIQPQTEIAAHLGEVLWELGQKDEARKIWLDAMKIDADDETLRSTLKRYNCSYTP